MTALVAVALAAPVAGFRVPVVDRGGVAESRLALVGDFDGACFGEWTLRGQGTVGFFGLAGEVVAVGGASAVWSDVSLGNAAIETRVAFGTEMRHGMGLRATLPLGQWVDGGASYWGTVPIATIPMLGIATFWEAGWGRWAWRLRAGIRTLGYYAGGYPGQSLDLGLLVATAQPVGDRWQVVAEAEALFEPSPFHLRVLVRRELRDGWTGDLGLAVPVPGMITDPSVQVLLRVARAP